MGRVIDVDPGITNPRDVTEGGSSDRKLIGIDLGTTNSCIAVMEGGTPQVIPNQFAERTTPSVVGFSTKGERIVGCIAKWRQVVSNPKNTVFAVKRLIGQKFDSEVVTHARQFLPYELVKAPNGDTHVQIDDKVYSIPEITSFILRRLKAAAETYLGESVTGAVVTVPASFNDPQRQATRDAGLIAGFTTVRLINEPTAAALAYGKHPPPRYLAAIESGEHGRFVPGPLLGRPQRTDGHLVAVYDLGGGTFDITILEMSDGAFQVRATGGDTFLGGEDFDQRIIDWIIYEFMRETGIDLTQDPAAMQRLTMAAERAKCELSTSQQTEIVLPFIAGSRHFKTVLTRERYAELTDDLLVRTENLCRRCLEDAGVRADQVNEVLLVGGQTRDPRTAGVVRRVFGREPNRGVNVDEGVAMGAAIQAGVITGDVRDPNVRDVTPHTLGVETANGTFTPLIERNTTIPTRKRLVFTTVADNQSRVEVHVLQGESDLAANNKSLARFELTNIPYAPRSVPQIEVTFEIDVNGIVSVEARDLATGRSQIIVIHPSGGLSQSEANRLATEARALGQRERLDEEAEWHLHELNQVVGIATPSVQALAMEGKLTPDEEKRIFTVLETARKSLSSGDLEEWKVSLADLKEVRIIFVKAAQRVTGIRPDPLPPSTPATE